MIGSEAERQFYLGAAGIRMWYARQPLPGAAPSPGFVYPEEDAAPETVPGQPEPVARRASGSGRAGMEKPTVPDRTEGVARIADLQALMGGNAGVPEKAPPQSPATPSLPEVPTEAPNSGFSEEVSVRPSRIPTVSANLMIWAGSNVVLIGGMSEDASGRLQETLAMNILKSLGEHKPRVLGRVVWPIFNNLLVPGNSGHDLVEVIRHILSGLERKPVVVLQAGEDSEQGWVEAALGRDAAVRFPHTLAEIAGNPTLKRSLWQQIRPMVAR